MENDSKDPQQSKPRGLFRGPNLWLLVIGMLVLGAMLVLSNQGPPTSIIQLSFFKKQIEEQNILYVKLGDRDAIGMFKESPIDPGKLNDEGELEYTKEKDGEPQPLENHFRVIVGTDSEQRSKLMDLLDDAQIPHENLASSDDAMTSLMWTFVLALPIVILIIMWISYRRTRNDLMGGGFLSGFSKSPAKRYDTTPEHTTFDDVAGLKSAKNDLMEIVDFLKSPERFQKLGGRVPKGVLLNGPPGTGKTLLARAVAGEAGVPFYSVNGSEFIQMFVGVGASRVRDLFNTAKQNSPAIIFIDEIDAVGRQRGAGLGGGHDEREQTLNQILSEMDGFAQTDSVIVLAATNRPDVLDPALLRPGRFDRHVTVDRPTQKGRVEILNVHVRDVPLSDDVNLQTLAAATIGLTGADLRNIVNEAALWAARHDKTKVEMSDFEYAHDKVLMGAKREEVINEDEKEKTAYHEAGHTLMAWILPGSHRVHKVTIIPRGRTLGATQMLPGEDRMNMSEHELRDHLIVLLGGRAAEKLIYDETTVGAENDLERATAMARRMVTHWGMSQQLGPVSYKMSEDDPFLGREIHQQRQFSEHTMELIDGEVTRILHEASEQAGKLLQEERDKLERLAKSLVENEELNSDEITELIGLSIHAVADSNGSGAPSGSVQDEAAKDAVSNRQAEQPGD